MYATACTQWSLPDNNVYYISDHIARRITLLVDCLLKAAQIIDVEAWLVYSADTVFTIDYRGGWSRYCH